MHNKIFKLKVTNKIFYLKPLKKSYVNQNYLNWFADKDIKNNGGRIFICPSLLVNCPTEHLQ